MVIWVTLTCSLVEGPEEDGIIRLLAVGGKVGMDNIGEGLQR